MKNLLETIAQFEVLVLTKKSDHPAREKLLREKGLPVYEETETPPPSENKPIDEEKVADYHQMVGLRYRIKQLQGWIDDDPFAFADVAGELRRRKLELKVLLDKRTP